MTLEIIHETFSKKKSEINTDKTYKHRKKK